MKLESMVNEIKDKLSVSTLETYRYDEDGKLVNRLIERDKLYLNKDITYDKEGNISQEKEVTYEGKGMKRSTLGVEVTEYKDEYLDLPGDKKFHSCHEARTVVELKDQGITYLAIKSNIKYHQDGTYDVNYKKYNKNGCIIFDKYSKFNSDDELLLSSTKQYNDEGVLVVESSGSLADKNTKLFVTVVDDKKNKLLNESSVKNSKVEGFRDTKSIFKSNNIIVKTEIKYQENDDGFVENIIRSESTDQESKKKILDKTDTYTLSKTDTGYRLMGIKEVYVDPFTHHYNTIESYYDFVKTDGLTKAGYRLLKFKDTIVVNNPDNNSTETYHPINGNGKHDLVYHFDQKDVPQGDLYFLRGELVKYSFRKDTEYLYYVVNFSHEGTYTIEVEEHDKETGNLIQKITATSLEDNMVFYDIADIFVDTLRQHFMVSIQYRGMDRSIMLHGMQFNKLKGEG